MPLGLPSGWASRTITLCLAGGGGGAAARFGAQPAASRSRVAQPVTSHLPAILLHSIQRNRKFGSAKSQHTHGRFHAYRPRRELSDLARNIDHHASRKAQQERKLGIHRFVHKPIDLQLGVRPHGDSRAILKNDSQAAVRRRLKNVVHQQMHALANGDCVRAPAHDVGALSRLDATGNTLLAKSRESQPHQAENHGTCPTRHSQWSRPSAPLWKTLSHTSRVINGSFPSGPGRAAWRWVCALPRFYSNRQPDGSWPRRRSGRWGAIARICPLRFVIGSLPRARAVRRPTPEHVGSMSPGTRSPARERPTSRVAHQPSGS